ncbi:MAG: hypothetical protein OES18_11665 [Deltaproteobacteria bacterium]|nr:hypothetical protein [Deltaproteobacteria bacterium]
MRAAVVTAAAAAGAPIGTAAGAAVRAASFRIRNGIGGSAIVVVAAAATGAPLGLVKFGPGLDEENLAAGAVKRVHVAPGVGAQNAGDGVVVIRPGRGGQCQCQHHARQQG